MYGGKLVAARNKLYLLMIKTTLIAERGDLNSTAASLDITREGLKYQILHLGIDVKETLSEGATHGEPAILAALIAVTKRPVVSVYREPVKIKHG